MTPARESSGDGGAGSRWELRFLLPYCQGSAAFPRPNPSPGQLRTCAVSPGRLQGHHARNRPLFQGPLSARTLSKEGVLPCTIFIFFFNVTIYLALGSTLQHIGEDLSSGSCRRLRDEVASHVGLPFSPEQLVCVSTRWASWLPRSACRLRLLVNFGLIPEVSVPSS